MKLITVKITEQDGRKWSLDVLAAGTVDACIKALDQIGRFVKVEAK